MTKNLVAVMGLILASSVSMASTVECGVIRMTDSDTRRIAETTLDCSKQDLQVVYTEAGGMIFACGNDGKEIKVAVYKTVVGEVLSKDISLSASKTSASSYYLTLNEDLVFHCSLK
jgi:hypothetical protein